MHACTPHSRARTHTHDGALARTRPQAERLTELLEDGPGLAEGFDLVAHGPGGLVARAHVQV